MKANIIYICINIFKKIKNRDGRRKWANNGH